MRRPIPHDRLEPVAYCLFLALGLGLWITVFLAESTQATAAQPKTNLGDYRTALGKNVSPAGMLLQREFYGTSWNPLPPQGTVYAGDKLMALPGTRADIDAKDGAIHLTLWGNVPELSSFPLLESVVGLTTGGTADLEVRLYRGRLVVANHKDKGAARVHLAFFGMAYDLTLSEPGTEVAVELVGRWPPGYPVVLKPASPEDVPTTSVGVSVLKGRADLKAGPEQYAMGAPPGAAYFQWDNVRGQEGGPRHRDKLPAWAVAEAQGTPEAKVVQTAAESLAKSLAGKPVVQALADALQQNDSAERQLATYGLGAIDDLPGLADALADPKHADVRAAAIEALKNWLGRGPGQDMDLVEFFRQNRNYTSAQAETVVQLLHGFANADSGRAETYETLIAYLQSSQLSIRALASQYLYHWAPGPGKDIPYNPADEATEREKAVKAWQKLLADGKLPPKTGE